MCDDCKCARFVTIMRARSIRRSCLKCTVPQQSLRMVPVRGPTLNSQEMFVTLFGRKKRLVDYASCAG